MSSSEKKGGDATTSEKRRRGRWRERPLQSVGKRFRFRKGGTSSSAHPTEHHHHHSPTSYGTLQDTERRRNLRRGWENDDEVDDDDEDADDESTLESSSMPLRRHFRHPEASGYWFWQSNRPDLRTIASVETYLRWIILLTGSFLLGVHFSSYQILVEKAWEYTCVAWITSISLGFLLARAHASSSGGGGSMPMHAAGENTSFDEEEGQPLLARGGVDGGSEEVTLDNKLASKKENGHHVERDLDLTSLENSAHSATAAGDSQNGAQKQQNVHPTLDPYFILDCNRLERVFPNGDTLYKLDTDYFSGEMMVLIRTPDVDDTSIKSPGANSLAIRHLRGKQRRFEFQFQVRLKKVPTGTVYFSCELTKGVKMGMVQRAFVSAAMSFVRSSNPTFHYSIQGQEPNEDGSYERPHMSFPVQDGMNRLVTTPPGQEPPRLGTDIEEDAESLKRRKKGCTVEWNLQDTYTLALWSQYVDFLDWRIENLPGIRPFSLLSVISNNPIYLTLYEVDNDKEKHHRKDMTMIAEFEMSNSTVMGEPGPFAQQWQKRHKKRQSMKKSALTIDAAGVSETPVASPKRQTSVDTDAPGTNPIPKKRLFGKRTTSMDSAPDMPDSPRPSLHSAELTDGENSGPVDEENDTARDDTPTNQVEGDESNTEEEEAEAAAELGEGIYVQSGNGVTLRDASDDTPTPSFLTMGGGFAVLQEQTSSTIIIEKAGRSRRGKSGRSKLIKSGDAVLFKMVSKGRKGANETKYLSIHRGWWLKWVTTAPSNNGYFQLYTHETEFDANDASGKAPETQSSFLRLGGAFWLRHKRWSKFQVGVSAEGSTTYGGRMLGLYTQRKGSKGNLPDESLFSEELIEGQAEPEGKKNAWLKPLQLRAFEPAVMGLSMTQLSSLPLTQTSSDDNYPVSTSIDGKPVRFSEDDYRLDAPVWVEMMDRTHRVQQLAYVVRVQYQGPQRTGELSDKESFVKIRTGRDLAEVMRIGLSWRTREVTVRCRKGSADSAAKSPRAKSSHLTFATPEVAKASVDEGSSSPQRSTDLGITETEGGFETQDTTEGALGDSIIIEHDSEDDVSIDELPDDTNADDTDVAVEETLGERGRSTSPIKKRKFIGKLAHTVKSKTASTGKAVVRGGVKVGKGTMNAGRAIIPIRSMNPPAKEPNQKNIGRSKRETERDLHVAVSRSLRRIDRMDSRSLQLDSPAVLAGELAAPEQSARTVSNMLARMSSIPRSSEYFTSFNELLSSIIDHKSPQDEWFLQGGAVNLGIPKAEAGEGRLFDAVVARCLWESHWREEWCVIQAQSIRFYAPNSKEPGLELFFDDIRCIRELEIGCQSPIPGYAVLVIETAWMCHYIAFSNDDKRDTFQQVATRAKEYVDEKQMEYSRTRNDELQKARFWQGFGGSVESSLGKGKWAEISSNGVLKRRIM